MGTQNHLLSEIKSDLDWAVGEVLKTETEMMKLQEDFNQSLKNADEEDAERLTNEKQHLLERIGLSETYALQRRAAQRFYLVSHVFEIASSKSSPDNISAELEKILFRANGKAVASEANKALIAKLSEALITYFSDGHTDQSDQIIRDIWDDIEDTLKELGRS